MNRTGIEYGDYTWNPLSGCLPYKPCYEFCWARAMANRLRGRFGYDRDEPFKPTRHWDRLEEPLRVKKPSRILVVFMGDMFCGGFHREDWDRVFDVIEKADWHTFFILTKRPGTMRVYLEARGGFPRNCWVGTSITRDDELHRIEHLTETDHPNRFVSFEPLLGDLANDEVYNLTEYLPKLGLVVIGAQTGRGAHQPRRGWVKNLVHDCEMLGVPYFIKDNLEWEGSRPQEIPEVV